MTLSVVPVTLRAANSFVSLLHRHHKPARGCIFCVGVESHGDLVGVAIVGRPSSKARQDGRTVEIVRVCTDGSKNACSKLYGVARRVAGILGYRRVLTYLLESESGVSVLAAGFVFDGMTRGGSWDRPSRRRVDKAPTCRKQRWVSVA